MTHKKAKTALVNTESLVLNPNNPRTISEAGFARLKQSIQEFPQMLELRPVVVDKNNIVMAGNQRVRACLDLGIEKVPCIQASDFTDEQLEQFLIKDNTTYGDWDWDMLANEWDTSNLIDWGIEAPEEFAEKFAPTLEPQFASSVITQDAIEKEAQKLAMEMIKEMATTQVICPDCGHEFMIA